MTADAIAQPGPTPSSLLMLRPTTDELEDAREAIRRGYVVELRALLTDFRAVSGSVIWPPVFSDDTPFDTFTCRHCEWSFEQRMNGLFSLYLDVTPVQNAVRRMKTHLRGCKIYKRRAK